MSPTLHALLILLVAGGVTFLIRALPFLLFGNGERVSPQLHFIGRTLPLSVIAVLIVYCLKDAILSSFSALWPQLIGILITALLHLWKHNNLISIAGGTIIYMILIRLL
ncbi:MAG: AzlD domain-containing protein [Clostridia bacterium]|nr:AzlD domain-containing protein [Clostridia bacterium]MBR6788044.1 AzlD domain-containing protein [Clostridia bacterium]